MNISKTSLIAVFATIVVTASTSLARNKDSQGTPSGRSTKNNIALNTISTNSLNHGINSISDPGKKKLDEGTVISTNLGHNGLISSNKNLGIKISGNKLPKSPDSFKWKDKWWYCDHSHHIVFCDHFVEPVFARYIVVPGDTFETISLKLFNTPFHSTFLASINHAPVNVLLVPGQVVLVPTF